MAVPAAVGGTLARFDDIPLRPRALAGHVTAVGFDADNGRLDVAPAAPVYGTKPRWSPPRLIASAPP